MMTRLCVAMSTKNYIFQKYIKDDMNTEEIEICGKYFFQEDELMAELKKRALGKTLWRKWKLIYII